MSLLQISQLVTLTKQCTLVFLFSEITVEHNNPLVQISRQLYLEAFNVAVVQERPLYLLKTDKNIPTFQRYFGKHTWTCYALVYDGSRGEVFPVNYAGIDITTAVASKLRPLLALYIVRESYCHFTPGSCRKIASNYVILEPRQLIRLEYPIIYVRQRLLVGCAILNHYGRNEGPVVAQPVKITPFQSLHDFLALIRQQFTVNMRHFPGRVKGNSLDCGSTRHLKDVEFIDCLKSVLYTANLSASISFDMYYTRDQFFQPPIPFFNRLICFRFLYAISSDALPTFTESRADSSLKSLFRPFSSQV